MINIMPIFINFLAVESLRLDNDKIEKFCLQRKGASAGRVVSNGGGWQSDNLDAGAPELAELFAEVQKRLDEVHRAFEFNPATRQVITGLASGKKFSFTVAARNQRGWGAPSSVTWLVSFVSPSLPCLALLLPARFATVDFFGASPSAASFFRLIQPNLGTIGVIRQVNEFSS